MQYTIFVAASLLLARSTKKTSIREQISDTANYAYKAGGVGDARNRHIIVMTQSKGMFESGIMGIARLRKPGKNYSTLLGGQAGANLKQIVHYGGTWNCVIRRGRYDVACSENLLASSPSIASLPDRPRIELFFEMSDTAIITDLPTESACKAIYKAVVDEEITCITEEEAHCIDYQTLSVFGLELLSRSTNVSDSQRFPFALYPLAKAQPA